MEKREFETAPIEVVDNQLEHMGFIPLMVEVHKDPIVVRASRYKGKVRVSVRYHYWAGKKLRPTKRGIEIPLDQVKEVHAMLGEVIRQTNNNLKGVIKARPEGRRGR